MRDLVGRGWKVTVALAFALSSGRAAAAAETLANPPLVVTIRGVGAVRDPGIDAAALMSRALGGRLVSLVEPSVEEARAALYVADVVYLNLRQRASSQHGPAGLVFGRADEDVLSTRALASALAQGSPPPRLVLVNGSGTGADLGSVLDKQKTAVVGFTGPVHGVIEEGLFVRLIERFVACQGTTCPTLREAFAALAPADRPRVLALRGREDLRFPSVAGHAGNADLDIRIKGTVLDRNGKPAARAHVEAPSFPGAVAIADGAGAFVLTVTAPTATTIRLRARLPHQTGATEARGGSGAREARIRLDSPKEDGTVDDLDALASRLSVTVPTQPPYEINDRKVEDRLRALVAAYVQDARLLRFSLDEMSPLLARFEQALARGTRRVRSIPAGPPSLTRPQVTLCNDHDLRYYYGRLRDLRITYERRYTRAADSAEALRILATQAPHLADRTDAAPVLAAARLLRRDHADNLRRLDAAGYSLRSLGCREELMDVARPFYDPDIPMDFADRLPGGARPTILPPR